MNPSMMRGNQNVSQLQQRLTQQGMRLNTPNSMQPRPAGMVPLNNTRNPLQHGGGGPGIPRVAGPMYPNASPQMVQVGSPAGMMMPGHSPMGGHFVPSPQSGVASPGGARMGTMAPSPQSTSIRTPQNPGGVNSDGSQPEDQAYLEKVRQLSRYIEPLRKMIARIGNEDQEKLGKMKKLMDILSNPTKRLPLEVLLKCESVLEHMIRDAPPDAGTSVTGSHLADPATSSINPLLESIIKLKNQRIAGSSLSLNHSLHRTFGAPLEAISGAEMSLPLPSKRRRRSPEVCGTVSGEYELSDIIQGEVAKLQSRFKVSLDSSQALLLPSDPILLVCHLEDKDLPAVPPISITLGPHYPDDGQPELEDCVEEYRTSPFLWNVNQALSARLRKMPSRYTLTQLLTAWEMSVRAACSYKPSRISSIEKTNVIPVN